MEQLVWGRTPVDYRIPSALGFTAFSVLGISYPACRYNERNADKRTTHFDFSSTDPSVTNETCSFWAVRWAADVNMKVLAPAAYLKAQPQVKKVDILWPRSGAIAEGGGRV